MKPQPFTLDPQPLPPDCFYCLECGNQFADCLCNELPEYAGSDPSEYRKPLKEER